MTMIIDPFGNEGVTHPLTALSQLISTSESSYRNANPMIETNAMIHFSITLYVLEYSMIITKMVTSIAPALIGILNNMFSAMAPPRISARDVETDASIAEESKSLA